MLKYPISTNFFLILDPPDVPHSSVDPESNIDFNCTEMDKSVFLANLNAKIDKYTYFEQDNFVYMCPNKCGRSYKNYKGNLIRHLKYECGHIPKYMCPYCQHRSTQKSNLQMHINTKHPEHRFKQVL